MNDDYFKLPRLYTDHALNHKADIPLEAGQAHYLHNVLRRKDGDKVRFFNGQHGEWMGTLENLGKKAGSVLIAEHLKPQPEDDKKIHLVFTPIKKHRMDWLIEKAVELGVSAFHPVITQNTEVRKINHNRVEQQIFEAAEQCERLSIPTLHPIEKMQNFIAARDNKIQMLACLERYDAKPIQEININDEVAFLIGPEGGFTAQEKDMIANHATPVSLGETILRCETAVVKALVVINP